MAARETSGRKPISTPSTNDDERRQYRYYDVIMAMFVTVLLVSNIAASAKYIDLGVRLGSLRLAMDAGTLLFPLSYIFGDILTEVYGYRRSRRVIWMGFAASGLMSALLWLIARLPGEAGWRANPGDAAYEAILGGVANGGLVVASLVAYFAGEFSNSFVLARLKVITAGRFLWSRTIGSTLVGEGVDTVLFILIATVFGVFPPELMITFIVTNYIFKVGVEALMTPITYQIVGLLKRAEHEDYYDYHTDFNPFRFGA